MHRGPGGETPVIDGTIGRSEFGVEIFVAVGFLTHVAGMSIDKVCGILEFFWKLKLPKSQADALLNRLGTEWEPVFDDLYLPTPPSCMPTKPAGASIRCGPLLVVRLDY